jgi:hypothetical protein
MQKGCFKAIKMIGCHTVSLERSRTQLDRVHDLVIIKNSGHELLTANILDGCCLPCLAANGLNQITSKLVWL